KHINYSQRPAPSEVRDASLATPMGMAISSDGSTLYVAAFGSSEIGVFNTTELENNTFTPSAASHIELSGGGPTGMVLDEDRGRLYVLSRFTNSIEIVDTGDNQEIANVSFYNPEPAVILNGRPFLYDAKLTSSNGE